MTCLLAILVGCGDDGPACDDPRYRDGTCDIELSCGVPDYDCFTTYSDQASAQAWYEREPRAGHPTLPATDRRFARMEELLREGWEGYKAAHDVGDLADHVPQLVLIDVDRPNAFVKGDSAMRAPLVVMVHSGLIDANPTDDEILAVVMHELEHVVGLHIVPGVKERTTRYYLATPDAEPLGFEQLDDPAVRPQAERWIDEAEGAGHLTDTALRGLPMFGVLGEVFQAAVIRQIQANPTGCATSARAYADLDTFIRDRIDPVTTGVTLDGTNVFMIIPDILARLQVECFAGFTPDAIAVVADIKKLDPVAFRNSIPAARRALIEGRHFVLGIFNWVSLSRQEMRAAEADLVAATGAAWVRVRYFSTEEAADDSSVYTLDALGLQPAAIGEFLVSAEPGLAPACRPLLDSGRPVPYGENLADDHHGTCWRADHARAIAERGNAPRAAPRRILGPAPVRRSVFPRPEVIVME